MNEELEQALYHDFPQLFREHTLSEQESCMHYGCCISDHWEPILRKFCTSVMLSWEERQPCGIPIPAIQQVKQKYGGLRIYTSQSGNREFDDAVYNHVLTAEAEAAKTCEKCGDRGPDVCDRDVDYWINTVCPQCLIKLRADADQRQ